MNDKNRAFIDKPYLGLKWMIRLRWLAVCGQILTCVIAEKSFHISLPVEILSVCFLITLGTNVLLVIFQNNFQFLRQYTTPAVLALDTGVLTVMLYWTGGAHNPFCIFYLLHIAMAAILLSQLGSALGVLLCGVCYALLFLSPHVLVSGVGGGTCCGSFDFHPQGMFVAMLIVGACISFFVGQLSSALGRREAELAKVCVMNERHERFASLATLATGMAHELATPLGTIAVVSRELEHQSEHTCTSGICKNDARLIRSEVERCRGILEQLADRTTRGIGDPAVVIELDQIPLLLKKYLKESMYEHVDFEILPSKSSVILPQSALLQSLSVVLKNGLEASRNGQKVRLRIEGNSEKVMFSVIDRGCGMTPEIQGKAGEPFFTTKQAGQGTGLGLFLVRMFVERVNGELHIDSVEGVGSTFSLSIPQEK